MRAELDTSSMLAGVITKADTQETFESTMAEVDAEVLNLVTEPFMKEGSFTGELS